jgi:hypothetical protein
MTIDIVIKSLNKTKHVYCINKLEFIELEHHKASITSNQMQEESTFNYFTWIQIIVGLLHKFEFCNITKKP